MDQAHSVPFVSVVMPVYNDAGRLPLCLEALERQTYPHDCFEVIVVDNGSTDDPARVTEQFERVTLLQEARPGSYVARNTGVRHASGEILAFTDADCIPAPDWIEEGVKALMDLPNGGLVAGRIELIYQRPDKLSAVELYQHLHTFRQQDYIERLHFGATANVFTYRAVFDAVGGFNESLKSLGDAEWGDRVYEAGYDQVYAHEAVVEHPARDRLRALCLREARKEGGLHQLRAHIPVPFSVFIKRVVLVFMKKTRVKAPPRGIRQHLQFYTVDLIVRMVRARERIRLRYGARPRRL